MRIEAGKTYIDENGKKAGPLIGGSFKYIAGRGGANDPEWENDGTVRIEGEEGYGNLVAEWFDSPVRTDTVTVRRIEPGVYGRLSVTEDTAPYVSIALTSPDGTEVIERYRRSFSAPELRELARVALEIAEYLENVD